jgi:hypothetical protein
MDHLEVVKLMQQSGGKVWEDGQVSLRGGGQVPGGSLGGASG